MKPGDQLRKLRDRLAITTRDVEEFSRLIAEDRLNEEFYISNAWLTQLENTNSIPSIYKLYSLSVVYRTRFSDLLKVFGIDLNDTPRYQLALPLAQTHLVSFEEPGPAQAVTFPVRFEKGFSPATTSLISRIVEVWGEVPVAVLQRLNVRRSQYGYIGTEDFVMYPLLRPGSFVQIESCSTRPQTSQWRTDFDRPIYFIESREGYACSWCEMCGSQLTLIPHPLSGCTIRQFRYPSEAEIIGQVTAVAMRLAVPDLDANELPKLPRRS